MADIKLENRLDKNLRNLKVGEEPSPISIAKNKIKISGLVVDTTELEDIKTNSLISENNLALSTLNNGDILLHADGGLTLTATDHVEFDLSKNLTFDVGTGREIYIKENGGTYTPSADNHVATKKYVDDNAGGGTVSYYLKWGGQSGRNLVSAGYHLAIPLQYDGTLQNFGNSTDPDTSKTLSTTGDHFNNILVDFHDAITITGAYVTFGEGGSTNTTHNFHLMRYDVDADGDLSNGVVAATATNSNSDDYTHRRRATMSLSGTSSNLDVSTSQALVGFVELVDGTNTYSSYRYNIKYTLQ
tara:strand:- start:66 stop:968 length:903 start_codon:yes stop_codon:yes gene_type:complete